MSQIVKPAVNHEASRKTGYRVSKPQRTPPLRSARRTTIINDDKAHRPISPPASSSLRNEAQGEKRRHSLSHDTFHNDSISSKKLRLSQAMHEKTNDDDYNPVETWASTSFWPKDYIKSGRMSVAASNKRKSESTHRSDRLERLAENGMFMKSSSLVQKASKDLCHELLNGDRKPSKYCPFPPEQLAVVLERVQGLIEGRVQRDVTPWVVPSAELLFYCGEPNLDFIGDEVNAEWTRCAMMGSTRPKPDYAAGLLPSAFTKEEIQKLRNYASPPKPVFFTPDLCYPFLICEVKTGEQGLNRADRQNIHSASIAVRAVIELFKAAFGCDSAEVKDLHGQILVFTVSHDNDRICLFGHYAAPADEGDELEFYRYQIKLISLSAMDRDDRFVAYNFVRNVYDHFAPAHRRRVEEAAARLPRLIERTNLSFSASELALDDGQSQNDSQDTPSQDDSDFKLPRLPASVLSKKEIIKLREQLELQRTDARLQREQMERQMEQQRDDAREQRKQLERQIERRREDTTALREQMEQQMAQQMAQQREQLEQQKESISLLKRETGEVSRSRYAIKDC